MGDGLFKLPFLIIFGDLNFTLSDDEIWGKNAHLDPLCNYFMHLLTSSIMIDVVLNCIGPTW